MFPVRGICPHRSAGLRKACKSVPLQTGQQSEMGREVGFKLKERYIVIYESFDSHFLLSCSFIYSHLMIDIFWSLLLSDQHSSFKDNKTLLKFENLYPDIRIVLKQNSKFLNLSWLPALNLQWSRSQTPGALELSPVGTCEVYLTEHS